MGITGQGKATQSNLSCVCWFSVQPDRSSSRAGEESYCIIMYAHGSRARLPPSGRPTAGQALADKQVEEEEEEDDKAHG